MESLRGCSMSTPIYLRLLAWPKRPRVSHALGLLVLRPSRPIASWLWGLLGLLLACLVLACLVTPRLRLSQKHGYRWNDHLKTNPNTQALDKIVYHFKAKFRSFWDTILSEPWIDWALNSSILKLLYDKVREIAMWQLWKDPQMTIRRKRSHIRH
jgi:hypothetical protein